MTIREFIEAYNRNIDWNKDILMSIKPDIRKNKYIKNIIDAYLSTEKINDETCDLNNHFEIFECENNVKELQIYSFITYCTTYYSVNPEIDEKTYKKEKINFLIAKLSGYVDNINDIISDLEKKRIVLRELENDICSSFIEKQEKSEK